MVINETKRGKSVFYSAPDGLKLHAVEYGHGNRDALPVVCLPGLSRNARDFERLAAYLSEDAVPKRRIVCFDYRGRGLSARDPDWANYNVLTEAKDVIAGMAALDIPHTAIVGTSRGGLIAMVLSVMRPALLRAVVRNDVGPAIEANGLAGIRTALSHPPVLKDWNEAIALQKDAMATDFSALSEADWAFEAHAQYRKAETGTLRPDHAPAVVRQLAEMDFDKGPPALWPQFLGLGAVPVLLLRGEHSTLLSRQTAEEMAGRHPRLTLMEVAGQGHAPVLHTADIPQAIERFFAEAGL